MGACSNLSPVEKCLATIVHRVDALQDRNFTRAEAALPLGLAIAKPAPAEQARNLEPLVLLNLSRLRQRQDREQEARQLHEQANTQLEQNEPSLPNTIFNLLMAAVLMDCHEYGGRSILGAGDSIRRRHGTDRHRADAVEGREVL